MKSKDVLKLLNVSRVTLTSYVKKGLIKVTKLPNGYYDYDDKSVYDFIGNDNKINIIYARVSTHKQKDDLKRQVDSLKKYCKAEKIKIDKTYSEISSGIDLDREQFSDLLNDVFKHKVENIYVTNKDRITRLSFLTLQNIFKQFGTNIIVTSKVNDEIDDKSELFDELVSMMHYFSTREYSNRRKNKTI